MDWEKRFDSEKKTLSFLREFFDNSRDFRDKTKILKARSDVANALDSNWGNVERHTEVGGKVPTAKKTWTNLLAQKERIMVAEWVDTGLAIDTNVSEDDDRDKYAAEASDILLRNNWEEQNMDVKSFRVGNERAMSGMCVVHARYNPSGGMIKLLPVKDKNGEVVRQPKRDPLGTVMVGEDNQPIMEPVMAEQPEGLVECEIIPPFNFFPDHLASPTRKPRAVMVCRHLPLQWAKDNFPNVKITKYKNPYIEDIPKSRNTKEDFFLYGEYFEAGTPANPDGLFIQFANFEHILTKGQDEEGNEFFAVPMSAVFKPHRLGQVPFVVYYEKYPHSEDLGIWTTSSLYDQIDQNIIYQKIESLIASSGSKALKPIWAVPTESGAAPEIEKIISSVDDTEYEVITYDATKGHPTTMSADFNSINAGMAVMEMLKRDMMDISGYSQVDYGQKSNERTGVAIQAKKAMSEASRRNLAAYNERQDFELAAIILRLIKQHYTPERIMETFGTDKSRLVQYLYAHDTDPCDPKNVKIVKGSRARQSKEDRQQMLLTMLHQGAIPPDKLPYVLIEFDIPGASDPLEMLKMQKRFAIDKVDKILSGTAGAQYLQPLPGENLELTRDIMLKAILSGRLESPDIEEKDKAIFMGLLQEVQVEIQKQQLEQMMISTALKQMENYHTPTDALNINPETGEVERTKATEVETKTPSQKE